MSIYKHDLGHLFKVKITRPLPPLEIHLEESSSQVILIIEKIWETVVIGRERGGGSRRQVKMYL